jgi:hypothetical protein
MSSSVSPTGASQLKLSCQPLDISRVTLDGWLMWVGELLRPSTGRYLRRCWPGGLSLRAASSAPAQQGAEFATFGFTPFQPIVYLRRCLLVRSPPTQNHPRWHLGLPRRTLRPSKGSIWLSSTLTRTCLDGPPPKPTCNGTSASARLRFTKWCSPLNERD